MSVWRHLTHPDGMTVSLLVTATGLSTEQVRAELRTLEQEGKACRERAPIGKEHLWWRTTHRPLCDLTVITAMGLAARLHPTPQRPASSAAAAQHARRQSRHPADPGPVGNGKASAPHRG